MKPILANVLLLVLTALSAVAGPTRYAGTFRDVYGNPLGELNVHLWRPTGIYWEHRSVKTDRHGNWSIDLPTDGWFVAANTSDVLARGYFCLPGWMPGGTCFGSQLFEDQWLVVPCETESNPGLGQWGPGFIEWQPISGDLENLTLVAVPTQPTLELSKGVGSDPVISVSFETQDEQEQKVTRQWRIEKSADLKTWTEVRTVALAGPSPQIITDTSSKHQPIAYYRAVMVGDLVKIL